MKVMYGLTKLKGLNKCGRRLYRLATLALAAVILLSVTPVQAQAQGRQVNVYTGATQVYAGTLLIGLGRGQTLRLTIANTTNRGQGGYCCDDVVVDGNVITGHVKVFDALGSQIYQTDKAEILAGEFHSFDLGGSGDDLLIGGETGFDRAQVRVEVVIVAPAPARGQAQDPGARRFTVAFELIDDTTGKTTVHGTVHALVFQGDRYD